MNTLNAIIAAAIMSAPPIPLPHGPPLDLPPNCFIAPPGYECPYRPQQHMDRETWRRAILDQGERFCRAFPDDEACRHRMDTAPR